jgi:hypothetical protein
MRLILTIGAVVITVLAAWLYLRSRASTTDVNATMARLAQQAQNRAASEFQATLDYTPQSIERLESILEALHQKHAAQQFSEERLATKANLWGAYIGEVARRMRDGHWQRDSEWGGKESAPLVHAGGAEVFPPAWAYHRIMNGAEDNAWNKFQANYLPENLKIIELNKWVEGGK